MKLVPTRIFHARLRPRRNAFRYGVCYFLIPAGEWAKGRSGIFFSIDGPNLFSLRSRDYGDGSGDPVRWARSVLTEAGLAGATADIALLTLPRLFGFAFNPVSFWFCRNRQGDMMAVLCEVNNTFGERHIYLCHRGGEAILPGEALTMRKIFHVSPFLDVKGDYRFRFACDADRVGVHIDLLDGEGVLLATSIAGRTEPLSASGLLRAAFAFPLQTMKVVFLIHYQALKLVLKGVKHFRKPLPPAEFVSR
jgi:DUF1365 family protein